MIVRALERRATLPPKTDSDWRAWLGQGAGIPTMSGPAVNEYTALTHPTVLAAIRVLAESVGQLPLGLFERTGQELEARRRAREHPLYRLLADEPNEEMTSQEFREAAMVNLLTHGNHLSVLDARRDGTVRQILPLPWTQVEVARSESGRLIYKWTPARGPDPAVFRDDEVWHVRGLSWNGLVGFSPIALQRESVGAGLAMQEHGGRFWSQGAYPGGVLKTEQELKDDAHKRVSESWRQLHQGLSNAHRVAILEQGLEFQPITVSAKDAQWLEGRKFNRTEIAGWFRVPPHLVGDMERATFGNIEHQSIEFVVHSLGPWLVRLEKSGGRALLLDEEKLRYFLRHTVDALLRGDTQARYTAYHQAIQSGWLTRNEAREAENRNPIDGLDEPLVPLNMVPEEELLAAGGGDARAGVQTSPSVRARLRARAAKRTAARRRRLSEGFRGLFADAVERIVRAERREVGKLVERHLDEDRGETRDVSSFELELGRIYGEEGALQELARSWITPPTEALVRAIYAEALEEAGSEADADPLKLADFVAAIAAAYAARHAGVSRGKLEKVAREDPANAAAAVSALFDTWRDERPKSVARGETVKQSRAAARQAYADAGVQFLRWVTVGEDCPMCARLDGKVVGITQAFVQAGETFEAEGTAPLKVKTPRRHPPLHNGCDCDIAPEGG